MKQKIQRVIKIPEGFQIDVSGDDVIIKHNGKEAKKSFKLPNIRVEKKDSELLVYTEKGTKRESKVIGTIEAHLKNMLRGLENDYIYTLEICNVHFPMVVKTEGNKVTIKNFLGEKTNRIADILSNVKVDIKGNQIVVSSFDVEAAGQTAANIEKATRIKGRDRRIFQDGIFITKKPGREE